MSPERQSPQGQRFVAVLLPETQQLITDRTYYGVMIQGLSDGLMARGALMRPIQCLHVPQKVPDTFSPVGLVCLLAAWSAWACAGEPLEQRSRAEEIIKASGARGGLCVHLGVTDGKLTAALAADGKFLVHGLSPDAAAVEAARRQLQSLGLYGRASVERGGFDRLPYADNLVNLVVIEDLPALSAKGLALAEVVRALAPGGAACLGKTSADELKAKLAAAKDVEVAASGAWARIKKLRPREMDDWPSFDHGPDGNPVTQDLTVGPAASLRWRTAAWSRHGANLLSGWVSAGGRMFYCLHEPTPDGHNVRYLLQARDAFNGLLLWEKPLAGPVGGKYGDRAVVATADRLYLCPDPKGGLVALDAASGEPLRSYGGGRPERVLLHDGKLFLSTELRTWALDAESGKPLWDAKKHGALALAEGFLFGEAYPRKLACLDPATGLAKWEVDHGLPINGYNAPFCYRGTLVIVKVDGTKENAYRTCLEGYSPRDGQRLWSYKPKNLWRKGGCFMSEVFGAQGLVWAHADVEPDPAKKNAGPRPSAWVGLDPASGEVKKRYDDQTSDPAVARTLANGIHRCNRGRATENYAVTGSYEFLDWRTGAFTGYSITRSHCGEGTGMMPANGLVCVPPFTCCCSAYVQRGGLLALAHRPGALKEDQAGRLETGPAAGAVSAGPAAGPDDWGCYRRDPARSGAAASAVPTDLQPVWEVPVGRALTAPTVAGGTVYVASADEHRVAALDAADGRLRWSFTAGGRVDSPPTIHTGLCLFGCRDGWVYALRAGDGKMAWRFRAAPAEERIVVDGQLESAWPVHGSVLVVDGLAIFASGWHSGMDGGLSLFALRPENGQAVWKRRLERLPDDPKGFDGPVALLSADGGAVCMGRWVFDPKTGESKSYPAAGRAMRFGVSGFLDSNWPAFSNTKGRLRWGDGRADGELLASGPERTVGLSVIGRDRGWEKEGPRAGMGEYLLFGRKDRAEKGWSVAVPLQMRALVLAGATVFVAGRPDPEIPELKDAKDPKRAAEIAAGLPAEKLLPPGGELRAFAAEDGRQLGELQLPAPPAFDGLAAAGGRLYLATQDGRLRCFGKK